MFANYMQGNPHETLNIVGYFREWKTFHWPISIIYMAVCYHIKDAEENYNIGYRQHSKQQGKHFYEYYNLYCVS